MITLLVMIDGEVGSYWPGVVTGWRVLKVEVAVVAEACATLARQRVERVEVAVVDRQVDAARAGGHGSGAGRFRG